MHRFLLRAWLLFSVFEGDLRAQEGVAVRVITYNVWGIFVAPRREERLAEIDRWLTAEGADVVALQEVWQVTDKVRPQGWRVDRSQGDSGLAWAGEAATGQVDAIAFPRGVGFDALKPKGVQRLAVDGPAPYHVFNVHLQAGPGEARAQVRAEQIAVVLGWVRETGGPCVVMGDFNFYDEDDASVRALEAIGAREVVKDGGTFARKPDNNRYDRIWVVDGGGWRWSESGGRVVRGLGGDRAWSDHHALTVELQLVSH